MEEITSRKRSQHQSAHNPNCFTDFNPDQSESPQFSIRIKLISVDWYTLASLLRVPAALSA